LAIADIQSPIAKQEDSMSEQDRRGANRHPVYQIIGYLDQHAPFPAGSLLLGLVGAVYLLNPTAGVLELIPDNLPLVGNLDEAAAAFLVIWCGGNFIRWWRIRRARRQARQENP
jgi:uncharacterized membrane protein YkvA (DUF1232 family)